MPVKIQIHIKVETFSSDILCYGFDIAYLRVELSVGSQVLPIQIPAHNPCATVADDNSIRIQHWYDNVDCSSSQVSSLSRAKMFYQPIGNYRAIRLSRVDSTCNQNNPFCFIIDIWIGYLKYWHRQAHQRLRIHIDRHMTARSNLADILQQLAVSVGHTIGNEDCLILLKMYFERESPKPPDPRLLIEKAIP